MLFRSNAVIFAFGGSALFATSYHVVQHTCQTRLFAPGLAMFTFWGWQVVILLAAISLPLGYTTGKEYAELEWPIDILITIVWVAYAVPFFGTVAIRRPFTQPAYAGTSTPWQTLATGLFASKKCRVIRTRSSS